MVDKELTQRIENLKNTLGVTVLINEFLGWMSKDEIESFADSVDQSWDINSKEEID